MADLHSRTPKDRLAEALTEFSAGRFAKALAIAKELAVQFPGTPVSYNVIGSALSRLGEASGARRTLSFGLSLSPQESALHNSVGAIAKDADRLEEARAAFQRALCLQPGNAAGYQNLGAVAEQQGDLGAATEAYGRAFRVSPQQPGIAERRADVLIRWVYMLAKQCDWADLHALAPILPTLGADGPPINPFPFLALEDLPTRQAKRASNFAGNAAARPAFAVPAQRPERLRIGYFSADFHDHATMYLAAGLLEQHDRDRFEIIAYSYGRDRHDENRRRSQAALSHFREVRDLSHEALAELSRKDGIDIAVDLKGHTSNGRVRILAHGPAPITVSYLGYPGTTGASYVDYVIADKTVAPSSASADYSEQLVHMPHCYQINDDRRYRPAGNTSRAAHGLPDGAFVFCCFNDLYKVTEPVFSDWLEIMQSVEESVLWLLETREDAAQNLRAFAARHGVDPERLIFAKPVPNTEHIERLALANLMLDTFPYTAHTTASDALWSGVPIVTRLGESFQSRVSASLLKTVGLDDLITQSREDFRSLAMRLASDRAGLEGRRKYLCDQGRLSPLYDTRGFTLDLERAFDEMHRLYREGIPPQSIDVAKLAG